jgi:hypothetical protein
MTIDPAKKNRLYHHRRFAISIDEGGIYGSNPATKLDPTAKTVSIPLIMNFFILPSFLLLPLSEAVLST